MRVEMSVDFTFMLVDCVRGLAIVDCLPTCSLCSISTHDKYTLRKLILICVSLSFAGCDRRKGPDVTASLKNDFFARYRGHTGPLDHNPSARLLAVRKQQ